MSTFTFNHEPGSTRVEVQIDLKRLSNIAQTGVRRAAAFLGLGLQAFPNGPPKSVTVGGAFSYRFLPDPLPEELQQQVQDEFTAWLIGNALRELDQHLGIFLDDVWDVLRFTTGEKVEMEWSDTPFDKKFRGGTNVSSKAAQVAKALDCTLEFEALKSLSLARNALSHSVGTVRDRDANEPGGLRLTWLAFQAGIRMDGIVHDLDGLAEGFRVTSPGGGEVVAEIKRKEAFFAVGESVRLSPHQLSEICFFYSHCSSVIIEAVSKRAGQLQLSKES